MKTKNIIAILAALPVMGALTACSSDDITDAKPAKEILMVVGGDVIEYRANEEGPSQEVNVSADCRWTVELDRGSFGDDISVSPRQGNGNGSLVIVSNQNTDPNVVREAVITLVSDGGLRQKVTVRQKGGDDALNISTGKFSFGAEEDTPKALTITSNVNWTIQMPPNVDWFNVVNAEGNDLRSGGSGSTTVYVRAKNAQSDTDRTASFTINYGKGSATVEVTQEGMTNIILNVTKTWENFAVGGGTQAIRIESNAEWHAYIPKSVTWLHFADSLNMTELSGLGNRELLLSCDRNPDTTDRLTAVVVISGSKDPKQEIVLVQQLGTGSPSNSTTVGEMTSLSVMNTSAEFRFSFVADSETGSYGVVYSTTNRMPTCNDRDCERVEVGSGSTAKSVMASLSGLQESTTYYVRGYVYANTSEKDYVYTNVVTITTSASANKPGESDNPDPQLARQLW